jgi:hypothetical protein
LGAPAHTQNSSRAGSPAASGISRELASTRILGDRRKAATRRRVAVITRFDLCVANREKGEPGSLDPRLIRWHEVGGGYYGAYSWLASTWTAEGGGRFAPLASEATPQQQSIIFDKWSRIDPGAWPNTIPPCLYLE